MFKATTKITPRGNSSAVTLSKELLEASGLKQGDDVTLTVRDDGVIELRHAVPAEAALNEAFEWSLGRYGETYADLAK